MATVDNPAPNPDVDHREAHRVAPATFVRAPPTDEGRDLRRDPQQPLRLLLVPPPQRAGAVGKSLVMTFDHVRRVPRPLRHPRPQGHPLAEPLRHRRQEAPRGRHRQPPPGLDLEAGSSGGSLYICGIITIIYIDPDPQAPGGRHVARDRPGGLGRRSSAADAQPAVLRSTRCSCRSSSSRTSSSSSARCC